jgi:hypothetical protein
MNKGMILTDVYELPLNAFQLSASVDTIEFHTQQ